MALSVASSSQRKETDMPIDYRKADDKTLARIRDAITAHKVRLNARDGARGTK
jgi:Zn-finger domain-containing protein